MRKPISNVWYATPIFWLKKRSSDCTVNSVIVMNSIITICIIHNLFVLLLVVQLISKSDSIPYRACLSSKLVTTSPLLMSI